MKRDLLFAIDREIAAKIKIIMCKLIIINWVTPGF